MHRKEKGGEKQISTSMFVSPCLSSHFFITKIFKWSRRLIKNKQEVKKKNLRTEP